MNGELMESEKERIGNLIRQVQSGDKTAFEELYKLTSPRAYFVALKIVQSEHDAEDILQESYIKALEKIDEIDPDQNFMGWFYQVVANKSKDFLKGRKALVFEDGEEELFEDIPDENTQFSPEENLNQDELCREVMAAIDELTAEKRACVMMMYFGEMSVNEIAESLEIPVSTVKNRLFTARKDLKNKFEKRGTSALYSAAPLGAVIWALGKTSEAVEATFAASAASAEILAGIGASGISVAATSATAATTATAAASASTAAAGTGIAAKAAALTVAQKVVAGVVAVSVVGGSTAGVATVVKNHNEKQAETTTAYVEEVTTAPSQEVDFVFAQTEITEESTSESELSTEKREPTATTSKAEKTTAQKTTGTAQSNTTTVKTTTQKQTTTTAAPTTTTTKAETTTAVTTTQAATITTTQPTTAAPATLIIEIADMDDTVVDTLNLTVPAETQLSYEYLISLISANGYEAMAGVYGDAVGSIAEAGATYNFTAEL